MRASETPAAAGPRPRPPAADGPARAPAGAAAGLPLFLGGGRALDAGVRARMEPGLGAPLDGVRVHDDGPPARAARWMGARAFTVGGDVAFAPGQYAPGTAAGDRLLAHELAHAVQQGRGGTAPPAPRGRGLHEAEADRAADALLAGGPAPPLSPAGFGLQAQVAEPAVAEPPRVDPAAAGAGGAPPPAAAGGTPVMWGIDSQTRQTYLSVLPPGHTAEAVATWLYGTPDAAASLAAGAGGGAGAQGVLRPGTVLRPTGGELSPGARQALNHALESGQILRTDGVPQSEAEMAQTVRFEILGQRYELTQAQEAAFLNGLRVSLGRQANRVRMEAEDGKWVHEDHINGTNSVVRGISNLFGGVSLPSPGIWDSPRARAQAVSSALEGGATRELVAQQSTALGRASQEVADARRAWQTYIQGTIGGAESTIAGLEITRNVCFGIAAGLAGAVAAPAVFGAAAAGLGTVGVTGTAATVLSGGAAVGGGALAGGTLRGLLEVPFGGVAGQNQTAGQRFGSGFHSGAIQGGLGAAGALLAPGVTGVVAQRLYGSATLTAGQQLVVRGAAGAALGVPSGAAGAALENLGALREGRMTFGQYMAAMGWSALGGGVLGGVTAYIPIHGLYRTGGQAMNPFSGTAVTPRWMLAGPFSPLQPGWNAPPEFHALPHAELPPLPPGRAWVRLGGTWEPVTVNGPFTGDPVTLQLYGPDASGRVNYNLLLGRQLLGSRAFTRPSTSPYPGRPGSTRDDYPVTLPGYRDPTGRKHIRGHNVDHVDTIDAPGTRDSNMDPLNFTPEPEWWGLYLRNNLVRRIRGAGGQYRQMNNYRTQPPRTTNNGTPIPDGVWFVEYDAAGNYVDSWYIDFAPTTGPQSQTAMPGFRVPRNQLPAVLQSAPPLTAAPGGAAAGSEVDDTGRQR